MFQVQTLPAQNKTCLGCHTKQDIQPSTAMANALDKPDVHALLNAHHKLVWNEGAYTYSISSNGGASIYNVTNGTDSLSLPVKWAFGVHSQTWVLEYQGKLYESRVSFYDSIGGLNLTLGHPATQIAKDPAQAIGREISNGEAARCFRCHATGNVQDNPLRLDSLRPGIQCEHCHTNTIEHVEAISHGKLTNIPPKLKQLTSEDISSFCGQCHRSFSDVVRDRLFGPINVRFQPYRLAKSKCFNGSDARISCTACHDPHQPLVKSDASYEIKCLACHGEAVSSRPMGAKLCSTGAATGCIGCHMPKAQLPGGHQTFTDHDIRIVQAGEKYPE